MHIAIDVSPTESAHSGRGVGVYTKLLVDALQKYEKLHTFSLFTNKQSIPREADIVHYPYFDPFLLTLPLFKPKPTIVTVHDLIPLVFSDKFPRGIKGEIKWQIQKQSLSETKQIIADSEASKRDIARIIGYPMHLIDTVYLGPTLSKTSFKSDSEFLVFRNQYQLKNRYILYVGDVNWNKNIKGLLLAFAKIRKMHSNVSLVLVGKAFINDSLSEVIEINKLISSLHIGEDILRTGNISDNLLSTLYRSAICLVQPSFYEGFGLPVIDAMSLGCPVVVSDVSSLKEISGPSVRVNPNEVQSITSGISKVIRMTEQERIKQILASSDWVKQYSWKRSASETIESYNKALV